MYVIYVICKTDRNGKLLKYLMSITGSTQIFLKIWIKNNFYSKTNVAQKIFS